MDRFIGLIPVMRFYRNGKARRQFGLFAKDREFLDHKADVLIPVDQGLNVIEGAAAVGTAVVHEFHQRHIALGVAADPGVRVAKNVLGVHADQRGVVGDLLFGLTILKHGDGFHQDLGVFEEIGADLITKGLTFGVAQRAEVGGLNGQGGGQGQSGGGEERAGHMSVLLGGRVRHHVPNLEWMYLTNARCHQITVMWLGAVFGGGQNVLGPEIARRAAR